MDLFHRFTRFPWRTSNFICYLIKVFHQAQQSFPESQRRVYKVQPKYIPSPFLWLHAFKQGFQFILSAFSFSLDCNFFWMLLISLKYEKLSCQKWEFHLDKVCDLLIHFIIEQGVFQLPERKDPANYSILKMVSCGTCEGDAEDDKVHQDEAKMLVHLKKSLIKPVKLCTLDTFLSFSKCCFSTSTLTTT